MPEAAMNENGQPIFREGQVGGAWKILAMQPKTVAKFVKNAANDFLWLGILAAHLCH